MFHAAQFIFSAFLFKEGSTCERSKSICFWFMILKLKETFDLLKTENFLSLSKISQTYLIFYRPIGVHNAARHYCLKSKLLNICQFN